VKFFRHSKIKGKKKERKKERKKVKRAERKKERKEDPSTNGEGKGVQMRTNKCKLVSLQRMTDLWF